MNRLIWKTPISETPAVWQVPVPGTGIRMLAVDGNECWCEFTPVPDEENHVEFLTAWTGHGFDLPVAFNYIGTTRIGPIVVHLYWRLVPR